MVVTLLQSKVVVNISRPVTKTKGPRGGLVVTNRSKPGEYPKADTTQLVKSIRTHVLRPRRAVIEGQVGTNLSYGIILEKWPPIDRNYLKRTLMENITDVRSILTGPIRV